MDVFRWIKVLSRICNFFSVFRVKTTYAVIVERLTWRRRREYNRNANNFVNTITLNFRPRPSEELVNYCLQPLFNSGLDAIDFPAQSKIELAKLTRVIYALSVQLGVRTIAFLWRTQMARSAGAFSFPGPRPIGVWCAIFLPPTEGTETPHLAT